MATLDKYRHLLRKCSDLPAIEFIPTASIGLNLALGGGIPRSRVTQIFGHESSNKTTTSLQVVANEQKLDLKVLWVELENALDHTWAERLGVKTDELEIVAPYSAELALDIIIAAIKSREYGLIVVDSLAALSPKDEQEKGMDEYQRASGARMNNKFIRKSIASLQPEYVPAKKDEKTKKTIPAHWDDNKTAIILINQARASLDTFGPGTVLPGGSGQNFAASIRVKLWRESFLIDEDNPSKINYGTSIKFLTEKNKLASPRVTGAFKFFYRDYFGVKKGEVYTGDEIITYGLLLGLITLSGSWYYISGIKGEEVKVQGREGLAEKIHADKEWCTYLTDEIYKKFKEKYA